MRSVCFRTIKEETQLRENVKSIRTLTNGMSKDDLFDGLQIFRGYNEYGFVGMVSNKLTTLLGRCPTADEIVILIDGGANNFGAECNVSGGHFNGTIYTD